MNTPTTSEPESPWLDPSLRKKSSAVSKVANLEEFQELPSFLWNKCDSPLPPHERLGLRVKPATAGTRLKVKALCLPFAHV